MPDKAESGVVGRETEGALLRAALIHPPSVVLLSGGAGIGKSRLARALEDEARRSGAQVLHGDCVDLGAGELPYAAIVAALRGVDDARLGRALADLGGASAVELARLLPTLGVPSASPEHDSLAQTRLFEVLLRVLGRLGEERPVLLVLEDIHWADASTRAFLAFAAGTLDGEALTILATYRTEEVRRGHPLRRVIHELARDAHVQTIDLAPLAREQVAQLLATLLGRPPAPERVDELLERSGGNPYVLEQLVAAGGLPASLREAVLLQVDDLSPAARAVTDALAVIGRAAPPELVERVLGGASGALREVLERGVAVIDPATGDVALGHALTREVLYDDMLPGERRPLHRAVVAALADEAGASAAEIALHAEAAGFVEQAIEASVEAGDAAAAVYAYGEAAAHYDRAIRLRGDRADAVDAVEVLRRAAEAHRYAGDYDSAIARVRAALDMVDEAAEPVRAAVLLERLGQYHYLDDAVPLECYDAALALIPEAPPSPERARILAARGAALLGLGRAEEAREACAAAVDVARAAGAPQDEGAARATLGLSLGFLGRTADGEAELVAAHELAAKLGRPEDVARLQLYRAELQRLQGRLGSALELMLDGVSVAEGVGVSASFGRFMRAHVAEDLFALGRWREAGEWLDALEGLDLGPGAELMSASVRARIAVLTGRPDGERLAAAARRLASDAVAAEQLPTLCAPAIEWALINGRPGAALDIVDDALTLLGERREPLNTPLLYWLGTRACAEAAELARASGDERADRSRSLLGELDALFAERPTAARPMAGLAYRTLAVAETCRAGEGDPVEATGAAVAAWQRLEQPYELAYARLRHAEALVHVAQRTAARPILSAALASATDLGAGPLRDEILRLAQRARVDVALAEAATASPTLPFRLTEREADVLALLAEGLTNRQIGERLFIASKTAGVHVSRILEKLQVRNRVEAAGVAHRIGLVGGPNRDEHTSDAIGVRS